VLARYNIVVIIRCRRRWAQIPAYVVIVDGVEPDTKLTENWVAAR
jgi:hypothetical protein